MYKIAKWFNNFQSPSVLMIDDLSDAYIEVYRESYKNDWGYLCDSEGSSFKFLQKSLLDVFPHIKITFFAPYARHNAISEKSRYKYMKYSLGERDQYTDFLVKLDKQGHEIAHHGSNHGEYIDENIPTTVNNWTHEWALFKDVDTGIDTTLKGVEKFKEICRIEVVGGKYCGYIMIDNSRKIIDKCNFLYWCEKPNYNFHNYQESFFGKNEIVSFPTNFPGNSFVRLSYETGDVRKDRKKKFFKYFQPLYNVLSYIRIYKLYRNGHIISIQEHNSPSKSSGLVQSANIVTDIKSLKKIYTFLKNLSIWYANCKEIAKYIYIREHSQLIFKNDRLIINFKNTKKISNAVISLINKKAFSLECNDQTFSSAMNNGMHVVNLPIVNGLNSFKII
ncbi:hypothetical protein [Sulfurimonas sp. HSL3-7]|uniref:hypothetical protein n=1 Tax=Sulfonitrofixus jiaomeiensis TaxID=3131938 RepID=UPI0031F7887A